MAHWNFDIRTVILLTGFLGLLFSLVLYFLQKIYTSHADAIRLWALGPTLVFVSTLLLATRGTLSFFISSTLGNLCLFAGIICQLMGSARFFNVRFVPQTWALLSLGVVLWNYAIHAIWSDRYALSVFPIVVLNALLFTSHTRLIWAHRGPHFSTRFTAVCYGLEVVLLVLRGGLMANGATVDLMTPTPMQTTYIVGYTITMMMSTVGLILVAMEHLHTDLAHLANHDTLTGALLRRSFMARAQSELDRLNRFGGHVSLIIFDIDHFKRINDTRGHLVGDQVIKDAVTKAQRELRVVDSLGRYGGEEFVILLPNTELQAATALAERIRSQLTEKTEHLPAYSASFGVTSSRTSNDSVEEWLIRADAALYQSKQGGRNRVTAANN